MKIGTYEIRDPFEFEANYDVAWRYKTLQAWLKNPLWGPPPHYQHDTCLLSFRKMLRLRGTPFHNLVLRDPDLKKLSQTFDWGADETAGSLRELLDVLIIAGTPYHVMADDLSTRYCHMQPYQIEDYTKLFCDIRREDGTNTDSGFLINRAICGTMPNYDHLEASPYVRNKFFAHIFGFPGIYSALKLKSRHAMNVELINLQQSLFMQLQTELLGRTLEGRLGSNTLVSALESTIELKRLALEESQARGDTSLSKVQTVITGLFNEMVPHMVKVVQLDNDVANLNNAVSERLAAQQNVAGLSSPIDGRLLALSKTVDSQLASGLNKR